MLKKRAIIFTFLLTLIVSSLSGNERWAVYYAESGDPQDFEPFSVIVFEPDAHPPIEPLKEQGKTVLAYLNIGEVEKNRFYFPALKEKGILLEPNQNWPDAYMLDLRNPFWTELVVQRLIPRVLQKKFDGIFLDTMDNAEYLESKGDEFAGMKQAAVDLVKTIRLNWPDLKIMMNRGYALVPQLGSEIDMLLAESLITTIDFEDRSYKKRVPEEVKEDVKLLQQAKRNHPGLFVYTLDYWDPADPSFIKTIYKQQRQNGFIPYVSTMALDQVFQEPDSK